MKTKDRRNFRGNELMIYKVLQAADAAPCMTIKPPIPTQKAKIAAAQAKRERKSERRLNNLARI